MDPLMKLNIICVKYVRIMYKTLFFRILIFFSPVKVMILYSRTRMIVDVVYLDTTSCFIKNVNLRNLYEFNKGIPRV